jgi:Spy/CpxP family protein refolding chaperone
MRRFTAVALVILAAPLASLAAQQPRGAGGPNREALRQMVIERFLQTFHDQAGLTPDQDQKFRDVFRRAMQQRQHAQQEEQTLWRALEGQMRPGVAANADSVNKLLDGIIAQRTAQVDLLRSENQQLAQFLSPVQRAQFAIMWQHFQQQVQEIMRRRMQMQMRGGAGRMQPDSIP